MVISTTLGTGLNVMNPLAYITRLPLSQPGSEMTPQHCTSIHSARPTTLQAALAHIHHSTRRPHLLSHSLLPHRTPLDIIRQT
jgi:hypothetical protein